MAHLRRTQRDCLMPPSVTSLNPPSICSPVQAAVAHGGHAQSHSNRHILFLTINQGAPQHECSITTFAAHQEGFANTARAHRFRTSARRSTGGNGDMQGVGGWRPGGRASQYKLRCATATSARMRSSRCTCSCARNPAPPAANPPRGDTAAEALPDAELQATGHGLACGNAQDSIAATDCPLRQARPHLAACICTLKSS